MASRTKAAPEAFALPGLVNGKAGQQQDGDRMARNALAQTLRGILIKDIADDQGVIADDGFTNDGHIGLRNIRALARQGVQADKIIQRLVAAIEAGRVM